MAPQSSFPQVSDLSLLHWFKLFGPLLHSLAFHRYLTCHCYIGSNCLVHCCQPLAFHRYLTCHCYIGSNCLVHCCHGGSLAFHRYLTCHCYIGSNCLVHCCQPLAFHRYLTCHCYIGSNCLVHCCQHSSFPQVSDLSLLHWFKLFGPLLPRWHHSLAFHRYLTCHCYIGSNCLVHCCHGGTTV